MGHGGGAGLYEVDAVGVVRQAVAGELQQYAYVGGHEEGGELGVGGLPECGGVGGEGGEEGFDVFHTVFEYEECAAESEHGEYLRPAAEVRHVACDDEYQVVREALTLYQVVGVCHHGGMAYHYALCLSRGSRGVKAEVAVPPVAEKW